MKNLGFIGGGNMSTAVGEAVIKSGVYAPKNVWVSGPHIENLKTWADLGANTTTKNSDVINNCEIIFLGVKPNVLKVAVKECLDGLNEDVVDSERLFVSMLGGITLDSLISELSLITSKARVIRTMPNTPMLVGAGACLYTPGPGVTEDHCRALEAVLEQCGIYERVKEDMITNLGITTGCGPAFMYIIIEALADASVKQGATREMAIRFAAQTMLGGARMVLESGRHPARLKDEVCSPGGSTICGVAELERGRIRSTLINAVEAATARSLQMSKNK